jgi:hypothetical protein
MESFWYLRTWRVHSLIDMGVARVACRLEGSETGTPRSWQRPLQPCTSLSLYIPVKGPT